MLLSLLLVQSIGPLRELVLDGERERVSINVDILILPSRWLCVVSGELLWLTAVRYEGGVVDNDGAGVISVAFVSLSQGVNKRSAARAVVCSDEECVLCLRGVGEVTLVSVALR